MGSATKITSFIIPNAVSLSQKKIEREVFNIVKTSKITLGKKG